MSLRLVPTDLLKQYLSSAPENLVELFDALHDAELSTPDFSFYTSVASVFSSKIEGEEIELDSYIRHKRDRIPFLPDYTRKIDDLYAAYQFAQSSKLNEENVKQAHRILSSHILSGTWQGRYRTGNMYVAADNGSIEYVAAHPGSVSEEMSKLFADIHDLLSAKLSAGESFYYASMIHLVMVKIHPFNDGNGRTARLLEKWFLAEKLGEKAWYLQSERMYYQHHREYYNNLRVLGLEYEALDYGKAGAFAKMLISGLGYT